MYTNVMTKDPIKVMKLTVCVISLAPFPEAKEENTNEVSDTTLSKTDAIKTITKIILIAP